jgi:fused signal recognition particle receptor
MFKSLKEKLKKWIGGQENKEDIKPAKAPKEKPLKNQVVPKSREKLPSDEELKSLVLKIKKEVPQKFTTGNLKVEPDLNALKKEQNNSYQDSTPPKLGFFSKIKSKLTTDIITKDQVNSIYEELELAFLENNVALKVVDKIKQKLSEDLVGLSVKKGEIEKTILESLKKAISEVLNEPKSLIEEIKNHSPPYIIIFFGVNGTGKTTSIAKLSYLLKKNNISCALAAADTFRAASIEQLEIHANNLKVPIIKSQYSSDPTSVAFDAKKYVEKNKIQCLLIDTAGRMYTKENLIKQMEKMIRIIEPQKKIFVGESIAGNDVIEQAKTFNEAIGIDGIILSKADVDEKSGAVLSVSYVTGKPIYFLGTGQEYKDLEQFNKSKILKSLGLD